MTLESIVTKQHLYFNKNISKNIAFRKAMLHKLFYIIKKNESALLEALRKDLNKSKTEAYMTEISIVYDEIKYALKHIDKWAKPKRVPGTLATFPAKNFIYPEPYGVVLILAPWNYPFNLSMSPLVGAIAAGNTAILKCSKTSSYTGNLIRTLINKNFKSEYIYCTDPGIDYDDVLRQSYDYIFFTGSPKVGKIIMQAASQHLTPISLELGGKSPCFIDKTANLEISAKRIVWGKFLNAGQTCISIDYILVDQSVSHTFITCLKKEINRQFRHAEKMATYPKIINQHHFDRLLGLIERSPHVIGGKSDSKSLKIAPSLFTHVDFDQEIMEEEIFGPILPIITYQKLNDVLFQIKNRPKPLATYIFTKRKAYADKITHEISFGGGCINDVLMHVANHHLPFGGVGNSGMGAYHGKYSFESFSHMKSMVKNTTSIDLPFRYPPYDEKKFKLLKKLL